ncbi:MAG: tyrosine-type recombinase/integrase [Desulfobulbaceae bacterium]|nr:tyrosine-type recombinase/integrase [Desulfobulbaceae bacterium]
MSGWVKTQYADIRYTEHTTRQHNGKPDRTFYIRYWRDGKKIDESAGRWSRGMNALKASKIRSVIVDNIKLGKRPQSIKEMRQMELERQEQEKQQQEYEEKINITFGTVAEEYFKTVKGSTKKSHLSRYNNHLKPAFADLPLKDISPLHLERFKRDLSKKGLSPKTVHHCLTLIRSIFRKAVAWDHFQGNIPTSKISFPKVNNRRLRFLSHQEASELLKELSERSPQTHDQALLALQCGLRAGEILDMKWGHVDFKQNIIHLPETKAGESQQVFMTDNVKEMLLNRIQDNSSLDDYVFQGQDGGRQYKVSDTFKRTVFDMGLNDNIDAQDRRYRVVFHSLRHTFCSWLAIQGTPLYTIKELARHKTITQTERYSHLIPDHKQDAVKAMAATFNQKREELGEEKICSFPG